MKNKINDIDKYLRELLKRQKKNSFGGRNDKIDFDLLSAYIEKTLSNEEVVKVEKQISENKLIAELVDLVRKFIEDKKDLETNVIPMKRSWDWSSNLLRCAAGILVVIASAVVVTVILIPERNLETKTKRVKIYQPKRTRSISQPKQIKNQTNETETLESSGNKEDFDNLNN